MKEIKKIILEHEKQRCPKCGSNKWEYTGRERGEPVRRYSKKRAGIIVEPVVFIKYKCKNCDWEFKVEEKYPHFKLVRKRECHRCGGSDWEKINKHDNNEFFYCRFCNAHIIMIKKREKDDEAVSKDN